MLTNWIVLILLFLYSVECVPSKDYLEGGNGDNESVQKFLLAKLKDVEKKLKVRIKNAKIQVRQDCLRTLKTHHETDSDKSSQKLLLKVNFLKIKNIKLAAEVKQFEQLIHLVVRNNTHGLQSHIDGLEASCAKTMVALETMNSKLEKLLNGTESDTEGPDLVFVEAITTTTIYVSWKPPVIKEPSGVIRGYYVYYIELNDQDEPMQSTQKVEDTGGVKKEEMVIVGVKPDTRYQVSVAGYTRKGDGIRSRAKIVTTKGAAPGSAPRNVHARPTVPPRLS